MVKYSVICLATFMLVACNQSNTIVTSKAELGRQLFNDTSLSRDGTQSCASCHQANAAFTDARVNVTSVNADTAAAVSLGQDDLALGDINAPMLTYAALIPEFHFDEQEQLFFGGLFVNGRAKNLVEQAKQPFLNPKEMQTTIADVSAKVLDKYGDELYQLYGDTIFSNQNGVFNAVADAIAAFEQSGEFATFDSKFDRVLLGEAEFTEQEALGFSLFTAENKGNCAACHPVPTLQSVDNERLFTDFSYDNLGVPVNRLVREQNGTAVDYIDNGLFNNPSVDDAELKGAFRVPSLRNVAVTAPYMHNGVFNDLKTVVHFYNTRDVAGAINPETQAPWREAEVAATKNTEELGNLKLTEEEEQAIVAFLKTLTDQRFEAMVAN